MSIILQDMEVILGLPKDGEVLIGPLVGLEGLFRAPSREIDDGLISALVKRWWPETYTFHFSHGEMPITLHDMEVILGLPKECKVLVGPTGRGIGASRARSCLVLEF